MNIGRLRADGCSGLLTNLLPGCTTAAASPLFFLATEARGTNKLAGPVVTAAGEGVGAGAPAG